MNFSVFPLPGLGRFTPAVLATLLWVTTAQADEALRREVAQPLQAAQEVLKARRPDEALALLAPLRARTDLNDTERSLLERATAAAAMQARQFALAVPAFEALLQRPDLPEAERRAFVQSLVNASVNLKDFTRAARWALVGWQAGGPEAARFRQVRLQALGMLGQHAQVLAEARQAQAEAGSAPLNETEWRTLGVSQLKLKDEAGYDQTLLQLLRQASTLGASRDYWADLLPRLSQQPGFNSRLELDVYRLYEATGNLEDAAEFSSFASLAMKAGLPAEASRVLALGAERRVLMDATAQAQLAQARKRAAEDEQALATLRESARQGNEWAQLGDLLSSAQKWPQAVEAYEKALALGQLRRPEEVRLHYGRSLIGAGRKSQALDVLGAVGGDALRVAQLWQIYAQQTP
jgi:tetratricopeptide (TPR) repeat protein